MDPRMDNQRHLFWPLAAGGVLLLVVADLVFLVARLQNLSGSTAVGAFVYFLGIAVAALGMAGASLAANLGAGPRVALLLGAVFASGPFYYGAYVFR